jgi:hypothetical protein
MWQMYLPQIILEFHVQSVMIQVTSNPDCSEVTHETSAGMASGVPTVIR